MARKDDDRPDPNAPSIIADENDADDPRTWEDDEAEAVRAGDLSAAQLPSGHGNVDPDEPDAQYPPGVVDNRAPTGGSVDPADTVPDKRDEPASPPYDRGKPRLHLNPIN